MPQDTKDPWWTYVVVGIAVIMLPLGIVLGFMYNDPSWLVISGIAAIFFMAG